MAAVAYAFSGNVLFQVYNVVFLVGAAWLPLAVLAADRMLAERSWWAAVALGGTLALMIVGGDPQMAYNAGLLACLAAWSRRRSRKRGVVSAASPWEKPAPPAIPDPASQGPHALWLLAAVAIVCVGLAAIQTLPSLEATRQSIRGTYEAPRNLVELALSWLEPRDPEAELPRKWNAAILGRQTEDHQRHIYNFSVPPWRAIELIWPNISGRIFPTHRRWPQALAIEERVWTPSFYMGLLPFVFAASAWKLRKGGPVDVRFLSWAVLLSALASLGVYGWGWIARQFASHFGPGGPDYGNEVGGLYWLMVVVLPGYVYFRYPAKLLVVATLGLAMLAGKGWDAFWSEPARRTPRTLLVLLAASVAGTAATYLFKTHLLVLFSISSTEPLFGPFDGAGAWHDIAASFIHATVVCIALWCLLALRGRRAGVRWPERLALGITFLELAIAQAPWYCWRRRSFGTSRRPSCGNCPPIVMNSGSFATSNSCHCPGRPLRRVTGRSKACGGTARRCCPNTPSGTAFRWPTRPAQSRVKTTVP